MPGIVDLAAEAFERRERVRILEMCNMPVDYEARKKAFIELELARNAANQLRDLRPGYGNIIDGAIDEIERLREALTFARKRIEYYGAISDRRHFDHDLAEVYPKIDAALNQQQADS